jgi:glutamate synthase (NADPH/NADH) large chain
MDPARRAFYQYHANLMEPWDGPACVTFTDGTLIGAVLDRNGLRPGRYSVTDDGLVVLASETGVLDLDPAKVVRKGRLQPGRMFLVDTEHGRLVSDDEVKAELAAAQPYEEWLHAGQIDLGDLPEREHVVHTAKSVARRQQTFGYTQEELRIVLAPMARTGGEALGSMGTDSPSLCCRTGRAALRLLHPAVRPGDQPAAGRDPRRARHLVGHGHRPGGQPPRRTTSAHARKVIVLLPGDRQRRARQDRPHQRRRRPARLCDPRRVQGLYDVNGGAAAMAARLEQIFARSRPPSPGACASSCSPTGTPTATWRRSRRCCSPRRCTTTSSARRPAPRSG